MQVNNIPDDRTLLDAMRLGDERALGKLYDRYWMKLLSIAINRLNVQTEAEECVQDVFIGIWRRRESIAVTHNLGAYLSAAIRNQVLNRLAQRYTKKHNPEFRPQKDLAYETADSGILAKDLSALVESTVSILPEKCQMIYRLSRMDGKSNKTIASELNISEKTVEGHITKAIQAIRKRLSSDITILLWITLECYINSKIKN
jgi:RNA polymerase sigma-70 factor (ECF subfamily)